VLECYSSDRGAPDVRLVETLSHIGRQLGRAIEGRQLSDALRESESRFRSIAESANDAIVVGDEYGRVLSWNRAAERMFGYAPAEVVGKPLSILMPDRFRPLHDAGLRRVVEHGEQASRMIGKTFEVAGRRRDGNEFPLELSLATWTTDDGRFFSGIMRDIGARKQAEERAHALETAPDPIVKVDAASLIVLANARTDQLFGYPRTELIGRPIDELFAARSREPLAAHLATVMSRRCVNDSVELTALRKDGTEFPADVTLSSLGDDGGTMMVTGTIRDATERKRFEAHLQHLADHDGLTGLFNRRRFEEELAEYLSYPGRYGGRGAVLLFDLDHFKYVNDTYGHRAGDAVIGSIAPAIAGHVRDSDVVARIGGDEFAVLLKETGAEAAKRLAESLLATVRERRVTLGGVVVSMSTSIGVALFGDDEPGTVDLLAAADLAMYAAKEGGGDRVHLFAEDDQRVVNLQSRQRCAEQIRRALEEDRFELHWQPIIELASGDDTHRELLLRMIGDDGALIPPGAFIPTAERFGLIQAIDRWVVRRAIALLAEHPAISLEVNLSAATISDPELGSLIESELAATTVDPGRLVFEITETAAIANIDQARLFAERIARVGCGFALDDFGAGFSTFYYLKRLPLDYLKIDGDFIRGLTRSPTDRLIVKAMVDIAQGMGLKTIAEFVENAETAALLRRLGVDYSQGYHHGRPAAVHAAPARLR
jgi:diguanylate cyclase (GGDEF)-like protein/PAS domain S-box-containing protein